MIFLTLLWSVIILPTCYKHHLQSFRLTWKCVKIFDAAAYITHWSNTFFAAVAKAYSVSMALSFHRLDLLSITVGGGGTPRQELGTVSAGKEHPSPYFLLN